MFACHISPDEQKLSAGNAMVDAQVEIEGTASAEPEVAEAGIGKVGALTIGMMILGIGMKIFKPKKRR